MDIIEKKHNGINESIIILSKVMEKVPCSDISSKLFLLLHYLHLQRAVVAQAQGQAQALPPAGYRRLARYRLSHRAKRSSKNHSAS